MQPGEEPRVDDVLSEITALLATAYQRRARIRLIQPKTGQLPSTEELDNAPEQSLHELTLTRKRKESARS
ncbi:MAG TPA: hypothetical protein PKJ41_17395 [Bryobacteraceae bacterium]|nr:hypothetical protein [Bryobacteraceae bacterium]